MKKKMDLNAWDIDHLPSVKREVTYYDTECHGLALRLQPTGARSWVIWEPHEGKQRRKTLGSYPDLTPEEARKQFHMRKAGVAVMPQISSRLTFGKILDRFVAAHEDHYRPETKASMRSYFETQLRPTFGRMRIDQLSTPQIADWFYDYSATSPGGANQALTHMRRIIRWAISNGQVDRSLCDPTKSITRNRKNRVGQSLSDAQKSKLFKVLSLPLERSKQSADAILLMALTGLRPGEVLRLRWSEVGKANLNLKHTKTGPISVPLHPAAREIIERQPRAYGQTYVFPSRKSIKEPLQSVDYVWHKVRAVAGLPKGFRLHDLRHTFISTAIAQGETAYTAGALVGHKTVNTTYRYMHLDGTILLPAARTCATKIAALLDGR